LKDNPIGDAGAAWLLENMWAKASKSKGWKFDVLNLSNTGLGDATISGLKGFMETYHDRDLIELDISNNNCTDQGILHLADLCTQYRAIGTLSIQGNKFTAGSVTYFLFFCV
jgi:hypothetical protein